MPNYYNPYNFYPASYANQMGYSGTAMPQMGQQSYGSQPTIAAAWVDGEIEARGHQIPQGVSQLFMIDMSLQKIYWKSLNQFGMPNPMRILNFTIEEPTANLPSGQGQSGNMVSSQQDMSQFVTKQDFEQLRNEIRAMGQSGSMSGNSSNQNGGSTGGQNGSRGGNR